MNLPITPQKIYEGLADLPEDSLGEIWQFLEYIKFKYKLYIPKRTVKLGGLLSDYNIDITEDDISKARQEMWDDLGEINE